MRLPLSLNLKSIGSVQTAGSGRWQVVSTLLVMTLIACSTVYGQAPVAKLVSVDTSVTTKDNVDIKITYFKSNAGEDAPVVILLPGKGGNRLIWKSFAEYLQKSDFAVITVDLRGHGESVIGGGGGASTKKAEPPKRGEILGMGLDLEAVKKFLFEEHQAKQLNMNKLGIVASDVIAPVAIAYTELDWEKIPHDDAATDDQRTPRGQDVQALALLSPEENAPGLGTKKSLSFIRNVGSSPSNRLAVLITAGSKNTSDVAAAKKMQEILDPKKERDKKDIYLELYDTKLRGTDLLGKGLKTEPHLFNFLVKHVKEHPSKWRTRKSKLDE